MTRNLMLAAVSLFIFASLATADTLLLTNGQALEGTYLGGDTRQVSFMGADGVRKFYSITDIRSIEFGASKTASAQPSAPTWNPGPASNRATAAPAPASSGVTIPAGTVVTIRMIDSIDAKQTAVGERYQASIDDPVVVDGRTVVPRGADCTVQVMRAETGGRVSGRDELALKLDDITVDGVSYDVATEYAQLETKGETRQTVRNAAIMSGIGAAIGAVAGGGKGAAIGAGAGAGAGIAGSMIKGPHLQIPSETRLSFELRTPLPLM